VATHEASTSPALPLEGAAGTYVWSTNRLRRRACNSAAAHQRGYASEGRRFRGVPLTQFFAARYRQRHEASHSSRHGTGVWRNTQYSKYEKYAAHESRRMPKRSHAGAACRKQHAGSSTPEAARRPFVQGARPREACERSNSAQQTQESLWPPAKFADDRSRRP
jgi:hypothetical protein